MECSLAQGELMRLSGGERGVVLRCIAGTIWLTTGDGRDYLVQRGNSFRLGQGVSALAEALGSAEMRLEPSMHEVPTIAAVGLRTECNSFI